MNDIVLNRILSQTRQKSEPVVFNKPAIETVNNISFISLEELRDILKKELIIEIVNNTNKEIHFQSIYDFVEWYEKNKNHFSPQQAVALDTLSVARRAIESGCNCKRNQRDIRAAQYFEQFWLNNQGSDLLSTIAKINNANKVSINTYCSYTL